MYLCATNYITEIRLRATNVLLYNQLHHRNQSESYKCTTNYITEISLRATHVLLYNQLHHRNQSESYKCTSVQPTTSQKSVWELQMYICTTNCITEIRLRATNVPLCNQLHHRNQWELQMYLCTTNYITEISLRATHVPLYNQLHHRNQSESYTCTSVQPTTSQKSVWELQMYLCTTNYITEISLRATNVPLYNQLHHRNQSESYTCTGFDINFLTNLSIRASAILILLARNCKLLTRILECHICM